MRPAQRTLAELRKRGYHAGVVERWLQYAGSFGKRQDLFNIIDIIATSPTETLGVQACGADVPAHIKKLTIEQAQECYDWIINPDRRLEIWGWRQLTKKGLTKSGTKRKGKVWTPRIVEVILSDLEIVIKELRVEK